MQGCEGHCLGLQENQIQIMNQLTRIEEELKRMSFDIDMNRVEIYEYFPVPNNEVLEAFLSNTDGTFPEKRSQFEFLLYNTASKHKGHQRQFGEAMKNLLFTRAYVSTHRWPNNR